MCNPFFCWYAFLGSFIKCFIWVSIFLQHTALFCTCNVEWLFVQGQVVLHVTFLTSAEDFLLSNSGTGSDQRSRWHQLVASALGDAIRTRSMYSNTSTKTPALWLPNVSMCEHLCVLTGPGRPLFPEWANFLLKPFEWWVSSGRRQWVLWLNYEPYEVILHYFHFKPATQQSRGVPHNTAIGGSANKPSLSCWPLSHFAPAISSWCPGPIDCLIAPGWDAITYLQSFRCSSLYLF